MVMTKLKKNSVFLPFPRREIPASRLAERKRPFLRRTIAILLLIASPHILGASTPTFPRFAYVANNQDDTVSIFAIERARLRSAGYIYTGEGSNPRSLVVTPAQTFLYVGEGSVGIGGYSINVINGHLTPVPGSPFHTGVVVNVEIASERQVHSCGNGDTCTRLGLRGGECYYQSFSLL